LILVKLTMIFILYRHNLTSLFWRHHYC